MSGGRALQKLPFGLGLVLLLGGAAHTLGVAHFYATHGVPSLNRVLLDVWIAEAQLGAGYLFVKGARSRTPRPWSVGAILILWSYALPFLPVLFHRAPPIFWIAPSVYVLLSLAVLERLRRRA
jgi:hypothetical protein